MSPRFYVSIIFLSTLVFWYSWFMVLALINPSEAGVLGLAFFFVNLFFASTGSILIFSYLIHAKIFGNRSAYKSIQTSTRQAILFSVLITVSLWLQGQDLLTWQNIIIFIAILTLIEFLFISRKSNPNNVQPQYYDR